MATFKVVRRMDIDPGVNEEELLRKAAELAKSVGGFLHVEVWVPQGQNVKAKR